jgi:hypothetical protein
MLRNFSRTWRAGTRACRGETRFAAPSARPSIVLGAGDQSCSHRISLNVTPDATRFLLTSHPVVIGLSLPERFARASQQPICLAGSVAFQRLQQPARRDLGTDQQMNVVSHNHPSIQMIVAKSDAALNRSSDQLGDSRLPKIERTVRGSIEIAIYPSKGFAMGDFSRGWIRGARKTSMQAPGEKQRFAWGIAVRKASATVAHEREVWRRGGNSPVETRNRSRDESRLGRHECLHATIAL